MTSNRILYGYDVRRTEAGSVVILSESPADTFDLTPDDLRRLLAFAETGKEPEPTPEEVVESQKRKDFAAFLNRLILTPEERGST